MAGPVPAISLLACRTEAKGLGQTIW